MPPTPYPLGLGEGLGLRPTLYIKRGGGAPNPYTFPSNPSRPAALPLSLPTACRRSPAAEILHHIHHAVVLYIQSVSPPYLLDRGRRIRRGAARVHITEAPPLVVLDRIGSRGGEASTTTSPTFRRTFRCANLQGYEDLIQSLLLFASPRLDLGFPLFASVENFDLLCRETLQGRGHGHAPAR